jgi:CRISPR-associated protein Cas2
MRSRYIVAYDISDPKRLRRVHRIMRGFGEALQYSVFRCDLSPAEKIQLVERLTEAINGKEDSVLLVALGPVHGRGHESVESLGRRVDAEERIAVVV